MKAPAILVVEDNPTTLKLFRVTLEAEGYRVLEAFDGRRAIAVIAAEQPQMVIQDLVLPDMDGIALARAIRALPTGASLPIVAVSGFRRLLERAAVEPDAFSEVLMKPVDVAQLVDTARRFAPMPEAAPKVDAAGERRTILIIDDDPVQLKLTRVRLEIEGFRVMTAVDGSAALEQARGVVPDAVLCDVLMPATDGFELCLAIRRDPGLVDVPVVLISAHYNGAQDEDLARRVGASALVKRTPDIQNVVNALREALERGPEKSVGSSFPSHEHAERVIAQLKRHARSSADVAERSALQAARLSILAGIADALARSEDVEEALADVLAACLDASGISRGALYRVDTRNQLTLSQSIGFSEAARSSLTTAFGYPALLDRAMQNGVTAPRAVLEEEDAARFLARAGMTAAIFVPLLRDGQCDGALLLGSTAEAIGEQDLVAFARAIGAQIAQGLAMAASVSRLRDAAEASRVLNASLDPKKTLDAFGELATNQLADICEIHLAGAEPLVYLAKGPAIPVAPARSPSHTIVVTLVAREHPLGTVTLTRAPPRQGFQRLDRLHAEDLAQRAAVALDNARLYLAAQEANRLKDEFLSTVSHELRTPLNAILGWSRMLTHGLDDEQRAQAIRVIDKNARVQTQLVDDLLDTSRMRSGKVRLRLRSTDLTKVIYGAVQALQPAMDLKRMQLRVVTAAALRITADPDRLQQVVWNLLSNAIKFSAPGNPIEIDVTRDAGHVELRVRDHGQGIDPQFMPYVFDRFTQADGSISRAQGGLGLGLAITKHLTELHGGEIEARSEGPGRGSEFVVRLPLGDDVGIESLSDHISDPPPPTKPFERADELRDLSILVVDDEEDSRDLIAAVLHQCGARPICAGSCAEALGEFVRSPPDVLLSDIGMPGDDGYALIRQIRRLPHEEGGDVPAIALTGYARAEDRKRAFNAGYQLHLPKPVDLGQLITLVADLSRELVSSRRQP